MTKGERFQLSGGKTENRGSATAHMEYGIRPLSERVGGAGLLIREIGLMRFFFLLVWEELE